MLYLLEHMYDTVLGGVMTKYGMRCVLSSIFSNIISNHSPIFASHHPSRLTVIRAGGEHFQRIEEGVASEWYIGTGTVVGWAL